MSTDDGMPPLTALRAFVAAGQKGSFQDAARVLGVTPSAISHQVRTLEDWLGAPLFVRGARKVTLTAKGRRFLRDVDGAFARIRTGAKRLSHRPKAILRVSALPLITNAWLIPRLGDFEARHPGITLAIETTNRIADFDREDVDIGIRNLRAPTPGLTARKLLDIELVPLCARKLTLGPNALREPKDLAHHTLIHVSARGDSWQAWLRKAGVSKLRPKRDIIFDTVPAALEAAARGHGVTLGMSPLVWESPAAAGLVVPFAPSIDAGASYYVVHRRADGARPEVKAFVDWLMREMAKFVRSASKITTPARAERAPG